MILLLALVSLTVAGCMNTGQTTESAALQAVAQTNNKAKETPKMSNAISADEQELRSLDAQWLNSYQKRDADKEDFGLVGENYLKSYHLQEAPS